MLGQAARPDGAGELSVRVKGITLTPGGFLDFATYFRATAVGSGIGTNFAGIPYNNTVAGRLTELRETAQNSRLTLKAAGEWNGTDVTAYVETDFLGNQPGNAAVSSNSATMRMRVYFLDLRRGAWEVVAGQDWGFLTPNRKGLSAMPSDVFYSLDEDTNYQLGLTWTRQPQFRLVYHARPGLAAGVSVEQGEPYIGGSGGAGTVVLPGGSGGVYGGQFNNGASNFSTPGFTPDVVGKLAWETKAGGHDLHLEAAGLYREFRAFTPATNFTSHAAGGGASLNGNVEVGGGLRLVASSFVGDGGGRYLAGSEPDVVVRQDGVVSPVRVAGGVAGLEEQLDAAYTLFAYYSGVRAAANFDLSGATPVGYGFPGSPNSMNRSVQEGTLGAIHTFWKSAQAGMLQLILQASYLTRSPFGAAAGQPKNAHTGMGYLAVRYTLP